MHVKFHMLCGVGKKDPWPAYEDITVNSVTGEQYYRPEFDHNVTHPNNQRLFSIIVGNVLKDLKVCLINLTIDI